MFTQHEITKENIANFDIPMLDILIFLNLDHGFNFRYELDHSIRSSEISFHTTKHTECKKLSNIDCNQFFKVFFDVVHF